MKSLCISAWEKNNASNSWRLTFADKHFQTVKEHQRYDGLRKDLPFAMFARHLNWYRLVMIHLRGYYQHEEGKKRGAGGGSGCHGLGTMNTIDLGWIISSRPWSDVHFAKMVWPHHNGPGGDGKGWRVSSSASWLNATFLKIVIVIRAKRSWSAFVRDGVGVVNP